jgi:catechol 2,3-dioxygenase-like lactoylglutathione lyase family enzyme
MRLAALQVADAPERWRALGFTVDGNVCSVGEVALVLGSPGKGITAWALEGCADAGVDGLGVFSPPRTPDPVAHPNGALGIDHVVVLTPDFDRTSAALDAAGLGLRRIRDAGGFRQGFRRIGPAIMELVEAAGAAPGGARFWGLVVIVSDLEALAVRLGDRLGTIRPAVQPGRQIATLRASAGVSTNVAFMDPEGATLD